MNATDRQMLRQLIDQAVRAKIVPLAGCGRCGGDLLDVTLGCTACAKRATRRRRTAAKQRMLAVMGPCVGFTADQQARLAADMIKLPRVYRTPWGTNRQLQQDAAGDLDGAADVQQPLELAQVDAAVSQRQRHFRVRA